jgi:hypothetical protein
MDENQYHQLQYDRIDKLETKRENFSNYVLTISSGIFILGASNHEDMNLAISFVIFVFGLCINIIGILFIKDTMPFIAMHQQRARKIREEYDERFNKINESVFNPNPQIKIFKKSYPFNRHNIYILLHWVIIFFFAFIPIYSCFTHNGIDKSLTVVLAK